MRHGSYCRPAGLRTEGLRRLVDSGACRHPGTTSSTPARSRCASTLFTRRSTTRPASLRPQVTTLNKTRTLDATSRLRGQFSPKAAQPTSTRSAGATLWLSGRQRLCFEVDRQDGAALSRGRGAAARQGRRRYSGPPSIEYAANLRKRGAARCRQSRAGRVSRLRPDLGRRAFAQSGTLMRAV